MYGVDHVAAGELMRVLGIYAARGLIEMAEVRTTPTGFTGKIQLGGRWFGMDVSVETAPCPPPQTREFFAFSDD